MAVRLPSDIVADVMMNADPVRRGSAVARLQSAKGDEAPFAGAMERVQARAVASISAGNAMPSAESLTSAPGAVRKQDEHDSAYKGFERMVLRNLFETLLPNDESGTFGGGPSAGIWRSMAADQLAGVYTENGGIGVAKMLSSGNDGAGLRRESQWPYFAMNNLNALRG